MTFCIIILALLFLIFLIDWIPQFITWQSRIKMGQFPSEERWKALLVATSMRWLVHTPTIKLTDNKRLIIIDILKGNYKKTAIQHWQQAALLLGLTQYVKKTNDEKARKRIDAFVSTIFDSSGNWKIAPKEVDSVILAYAFLQIDWLPQEKYRSAYDFCYQLILNLKGEDGTIAYRKHNPDSRYVDTIGFICPFLVRYGVTFKNEEALNLAVQQITTYNQFGMLHQQFVPCHTYNVTTKLPSGLYGWGRGLGWYAIGLIDSWNAMPEHHQHKKILTEAVVSFAKMALQFQTVNGSWKWQILHNKSQSDSSTTATLAWFLSNAATIPELNDTATIARDKALNYLKSVTRRTGAIDFSQGDTKGIGVYSQEFDILPFTEGFCLRTINYNLNE